MRDSAAAAITRRLKQAAAAVTAAARQTGRLFEGLAPAPVLVPVRVKTARGRH